MTKQLAPGSKLGRYRIERELGRGGWGVVYLAHDTMLKINVALKVLAPHAAQSVEALERFKRELLLARSVAHPGICRVFDLHKDDDLQFITMEYIEGASLETLLDHEGVMAPQRAMRIARGLLRAVAAAHDAGIAHRDLKPSNILVARNDRPSILDFGMATAPTLESVTAPGFTVGTLHYVAPERLHGQPDGPLVDIYSIGVVLYRCVTGRFPYDVASPGEFLAAIASRRAVSPRQYNSQVSASLDEVIMRAIAVEASHRFASAADFERALAEASIDEARTDDSSAEAVLPWNRDINTLVTKVLESPTYSTMLRQQLAHTTVLFTDIVGITAFFDRHGDLAGYQRIERHNDLLFPVVEEHRGVIIKTIGDAIMATFARADDAVHTAVDMQRVLEQHNEACSQPHDRIRVRIGLHSGQALERASDVFGNAVNVAARVAALADGDQILVSSSTRDMLLDSSIETQFFAAKELKGKSGSYSLFAVTWRERTVPAIAFADVPTDGGTLGRRAYRPKRQLLTRARVWVGGAALVGLAMLAGFSLANRVATSVQPDSPLPTVAPAPAPAPTPTPVTSSREDVAHDATRPPPVGAPSFTPPRNDSRHSEKRSPRELQRYVSEAISAQRAKGLRRGDVAEIDSAVDTLTTYSKRGDLEEVREWSATVKRLANAVRIDRSFVSKKLERVNARFDARPPGSTSGDLSAALTAAAKTFGGGAYEQSNLHLNRALDIMEPGRR